MVLVKTLSGRKPLHQDLELEDGVRAKDFLLHLCKHNTYLECIILDIYHAKFSTKNSSLHPGEEWTEDQSVKFVWLQVISNKVCKETYPTVVRSSNICTSGAGGVGTCAGDSGGPLALEANDTKYLVKKL